MKKPIVVYIAGERQHAGKTVTSLGIISALCKLIDPKDIGYFKPVGQELVQLPTGEHIDKDVRIVKEFTDLDMPDLAMLSPVCVGSGVTREFISSENPQQKTAEYEQSIHKTMDYLSNKKLIIAEGTGHPGVGSVIGLSNARVANLLGAKILYLVGGGIGKPLDELEVDLTYFSHKNSKVNGILFNKVLPKKVEMMQKVLNEPFLNRFFPEWDPALQIFGYMPHVPYLNNPSMQLISQYFNVARRFNTENEDLWQMTCHNVRVMSLGWKFFMAERSLSPRDIAVIGAASHNRLNRIIEFSEALENDSLGGIILTCSDKRIPDPESVEMITASGIPALAVPDEAGAVDQILYKCFSNTKLQVYDQKKHEQIVDLFEEHFDAEKFVRSIGL